MWRGSRQIRGGEGKGGTWRGETGWWAAVPHSVGDRKAMRGGGKLVGGFKESHGHGILPIPIDGGPSVKILCPLRNGKEIISAVQKSLTNVKIVVASFGPGVTLL